MEGGPSKRARIGHVCATVLGKMLQRTPKAPGDQKVPYLRAGLLGVSNVRDLPFMYATRREIRAYGVMEGDLLVAEGGDVGRTEFAPGVAEQTILQNSLHRIRLQGDGDIRFVRYALLSIYSSGFLEVLCNKATFGHLTVEKLRQLHIPWPRPYVQRMIADYLDMETGRIDALTSKSRLMIELLEERRRAAITGVIRSDQECLEGSRHLRSYADVQLGRQRAPRHATGSHMTLYLRAANVTDGILDLSDVKSMNFKPAEQDRFALRNGDILVSEGSGSLSAVGASAVWNGEIKGTVCFQNTLLRLRPRSSMDPKFLAWWCRYAHADGLFAGVATGANIYHISAERVRCLPMTHRPLTEQRAIADYLDIETGRIDALISKTHRVIDLLAERRQAVITAAVTGELVVPGVAA